MPGGGSTSVSISIVKAETTDIPQLQKIFEDVFPIQYPPQFYQDLQKGLSTESIAGKSGRIITLVAKVQGKIVGGILVHLLDLLEAKSNKSIPFDVIEGTSATYAAYIMLLAVDAKHRRQGIAKELLYRGVRTLTLPESNPDAKTVGCILLHTLESNSSALQMYTNMGFTQLGLAQNYYESKHAILWGLALHGAKLVEYSVPRGSGVGKEKNLIDLNKADMNKLRIKRSQLAKSPFSIMTLFLCISLFGFFLIVGGLRWIEAKGERELNTQVEDRGHQSSSPSSFDSSMQDSHPKPIKHHSSKTGGVKIDIINEHQHDNLEYEI
jgi:ribosomal protein S18 acetylase RimI-like enzyme